MPKRNNLVYATGIVLAVGSLLEWRMNKSLHVSTSVKGTEKNLQNSLLAKWIAIWLLTIVLAFTVEQAPDFGGPLTLLILFAGLIRYSKAISFTFNQTQGSTK